MTGKAKNQGGFTLMELMICIAIIGILASIAIPNYIRYRERGKVARAQAEVETIAFNITMMVTDSNCYPHGETYDYTLEHGGSHFYLDDNSDYGLIGATGDFLDCVNDSGGYWAGPYMRIMPKDPWGNYYWFDADWNNREDGWDYVAVGSNGPDGVGINDYDDPDNIVKTISEPYVDP